MAPFGTILTALLVTLAVFSIIEAGVATKTASYLYQFDGNSEFMTLRNGAALLAFNGFLTFFTSIGLAIRSATGNPLPSHYLLIIFGLLWVLWLGGAAAFSSSFDYFNLSSCRGGNCGVYKATVAFGWLGWITLIALIVVAVFLFRGGSHDASTSTGAGGTHFSMGGLLKKKKKENDVEKAQQAQVAGAPAPVAGAPYAQQHQGAVDSGNSAYPVAAPGVHDASAVPPNAAPGYHGQAPTQQPFAGAYGSPAPTHAPQAPYDAAQAYAQQSHYEGQAPAAPAPTAGAPGAAPAMPEPQAPAGWSVAPLGAQPAPGAAPTAEIVAAEPRRD